VEEKMKRKVMKKYLLFGFIIACCVIAGMMFIACDSTGLSGSDDTSDDTSGGTVEIATLSVLDPPESGTRLPEISDTVNHTLSYSINDAYYTSGHTYRITGYFRASDSIIQVFQTTVSEQSNDSLAVSFDIPTGFPVSSTTVVPYRLFYQLTDETSVTLVLDDSSDLIYKDWIFTGTWYGIDWKSEVTNMDFQVWRYDTENDEYENSHKGTIVNKAGNSAEMTIIHNWDEDSSSWVESELGGGTFYYASVGDTMINATDEALTEIFQLMSTEPTTYEEDYAGDWWTGETTATGYSEHDNGIGFSMSDTEFSSIRSWSGQTEYPLIERGTISASGETLTMTVTHVSIDDKPDYFTPVDPDEAAVYTMTYSYDESEEYSLTLTEVDGAGGIYADADGISYKIP